MVIFLTSDWLIQWSLLILLDADWLAEQSRDPAANQSECDNSPLPEPYWVTVAVLFLSCSILIGSAVILLDPDWLAEWSRDQTVGQSEQL